MDRYRRSTGLAIIFLLFMLVFNPFLFKSKGMQGLSIVLSPLAFLAWSVWFTRPALDQGLPINWLVMFAVPLAASLLVFSLRVLAIRIVARFKKKQARNPIG